MANTISKPQLNEKDFLTLSQLSKAEITGLLDEAVALKKQTNEGTREPHLKGKVLGMIFEKASTRTRVSFEVGMLQLGGEAIFLSSNDSQIGRGESIFDTANVLSRYVDGLMIRTFSHDIVESYAQHATVPVINGLTDMHHPTQVLADLLTIYEHKGKLSGLKLAFLGDGNNNMCHSLIEGAVKVGMDIAIACPTGYEPNQEILQQMKQEAEQNGTKVEYSEDPYGVITDADIVVTDVWSSMGQEDENDQRNKIFTPYQVNESLCENAKSDFIFLHCLPAHRGEEVTAGIIDSPHSVVFDEAENRLHAQKALLKLLLEDGGIKHG
ncbi:ornithine carbamoyltransferase [Virgibacillus litoralis]|uniref:Ornithine carbamoyltransferase n=1 Tax=Virgibacillus litoralis TaxID=578221 RepID=A0ABS4HF82_9BACI|nr:ornithine carbamoyltransferase [Virgibacillus litoralis]